MKQGSAIVLSGPSGVGKSTLINMVRSKFANLEFSVSCTTRSPRTGEENGVSYHFISNEEFEAKVNNREFIEYAGVFGKRYGTLRSEIISRVEQGKNVILDIDVQGATQIMEYAKGDAELSKLLEYILIAPPSLEDLESRLRGRNTESEEQLQLRLSKAAEELSFWKLYKYIIINDNVEDAANKFTTLIRGFELKTALINEEIF